MPMKTLASHARRIEPVREGRAGLIPASDAIVAEKQARLDRASRIIRTVKPFLGSVTRVSDDHAMTNVLAYLRHYCDHKSLAFSKLGAEARRLYLDEKADDAQ
jgi:hypothetical protein